jgi:hypothetical protein
MDTKKSQPTLVCPISLKKIKIKLFATVKQASLFQKRMNSDGRKFYRSFVEMQYKFTGWVK